VSVDASDTLERSVLENKDREQLLAIAAALGVKAGSRTKKADIIDKILEQTGVTPARGNAGSTDLAATPARPAPARPARAQPPAVAALHPGPETVGRGPAGQEPAAPWEGEVGRDGDVGDADDGDDADDDEADEADDADDVGVAVAHSGFPAADGTSASSRRRRRRRERERERRLATQGAVPAGEWARPGDERDQREVRFEDAPAPLDTAVGAADGPGGADVAASGDLVEVAGFLDLRDEGYGFLRVHGYLPSRDDAYVSVKQTRQYGLRRGDHVTGACRPAGRNEKNPALLRIDSVNGADPELARSRPKFEDLTPLFPDEKLKMENPQDPAAMTARIIDLVAPIGKGQRGLIVSPPKAGKTVIMKTIATSIERNNPEVKLIVLLIDERPEEVTDMRRTVQGEVIASTFDRPSEEHTHVAELAIERAKRLVELGHDVVIILDGITRLARAYNLAAPATGRIMSGGIDAGALYPPKKFFGAARNIEEGGSLTILATALVETNSRMDEAIFEEFKGTGNMELRLDRRLAERRIYPAIDVDASSTRHEELLFPRQQLQQVWKLRRVLGGLAEGGSAAAGLELLIDRLKTFRTNDEFLAEVARQPSTM